MVKINLKPLKAGKKYDKNVLYKIEESRIVSFEQEKFKAVADYIEQSLKKEDDNVSMLVATKLKNSLRPYENMIQPLRKFSQRSLEISGMKYELQVYLLEKVSDAEYEITINFSSD